jgi:HEAT repeat protein
MENPSPAVRVLVSTIFGDIVPISTASVPSLSKAVQDSDPQVRQSASDALVKIDKGAAVTALIEASKSADVFISTQAMAGLGALGADAKDAVAPLTDLSKNTNIDLRAAAAGALEKIGTPEAKKSLDVYNKQQTQRAVAAAIKELRKDPKMVNMLAVDNISRMGQPGVIQVSLLLKDPSDVVRESAAKILNRIGKDSIAAIPALTEALDDNVAAVRHESAEALAKIGTPAATKPLTLYRVKELSRDAMHAVHLN